LIERKDKKTGSYKYEIKEKAKHNRRNEKERYTKKALKQNCFHPHFKFVA
jgi:hypothetical protein